MTLSGHIAYPTRLACSDRRPTLLPSIDHDNQQSGRYNIRRSWGLNDLSIRGIDHLQTAIVSLSNPVYYLVPNAGLAPPIEAIVDRCARAVPRRQIPPRRTRAQNPEYPVQNPPIVNTSPRCCTSDIRSNSSFDMLYPSVSACALRPSARRDQPVLQQGGVPVGAGTQFHAVEQLDH